MQRSGFADVDAGAMRAHIQIVQVCTAARATVAGAVNQQCRFEEPAARERGQAIRSVFPLSGQRLHHRIAVQLVAASVAHGLQFGVVAQVQKEQHALVEIQAGRVSFEAAANRQGALAEVLPAALSCAPSMVPADSVLLAERLLADDAFRSEQVALLCAAADRFTWADSAAALVDLVSRTLVAPSGRRSFGSPDSLRGRRRLVDRAVGVLRSAPWLHRIVVGTDTRRQKALRRAANWLRRMSA